jgi:hypothetical protein
MHNVEKERRRSKGEIIRRGYRYLSVSKGFLLIFTIHRSMYRFLAEADSGIALQAHQL